MAQLTDIESQINRSGFFKYTSLGQFLKNFFELALILGTIAAFLYLLWGAIDFIIAGGNQERAKTAKNNITGAVMGLALLAAVWVVWRVVIYFLGLSSSLLGPVEFRLPSP
ncbi:MAG: hypothetical protein NTZ93_04270 [Candidatus Beckwithbacteria bacterium]|nr:hypothetical protein [Candidatus Beckwithbacteria bacterium]